MFTYLYWIIRVLMVTSLILSIALFFQRRRRARKVLLQLSIGTLSLAWIFGVAYHVIPELKHFDPSWFLEMLYWHGYEDLLFGLFITANISILVILGALVSKHRGEAHAPSPVKNTSAIHLVKTSRPMLGGLKILSVATASLCAILMLVFAREVFIERYMYGLPVDMPMAAYGACIDYYCENMMISIGSNGEISNRERMLSLEELDWLVAEKTADNPRREGRFMDGAGDVYRDEYVQDIVVHLRVDANCPFNKAQDILRVLERRKIRYAYFRVAEE